MDRFIDACYSRSMETPRQILMFGREWTRGMSSFLRHYMTEEPSIVVTSKLEASVVARVKPVGKNKVIK